MSKQKIGDTGETLAANYLSESGYEIITSNWRCRFGEIDVVARDRDTLIFVEVRTRRTSADDALASITLRKRERMIRTAYAYLNAHQLSDDAAWRIDVIAVVLQQDARPQITHVEDALDWST